MGRANGGTLLGHEQHRQRRNNSDREEIQGSTEEDEGSEDWTYYLIRDQARRKVFAIGAANSGEGGGGSERRLMVCFGAILRCKYAAFQR